MGYRACIARLAANATRYPTKPSAQLNLIDLSALIEIPSPFMALWLPTETEINLRDFQVPSNVSSTQTSSVARNV